MRNKVHILDPMETTMRAVKYPSPPHQMLKSKVWVPEKSEYTFDPLPWRERNPTYAILHARRVLVDMHGV